MTAIFLGASLPTTEWSAWSIALTGVAGGVLGGVLLGAVTGIVARDLQPWAAERQSLGETSWVRASSSAAEAAMAEAESRRIAGLLGPTMIVMIVSEFPLVQPRLYDMQIPPVVYLSGVLMFVAGLAIVRAHNRWGADWTVLVTLSGWFALALGVVRMFAASRYQQRAASIESTTFMAIESVLLVCGLVMTFKAYVRRGTADQTKPVD